MAKVFDIVVVDDEPLAINVLKNFIDRFSNLNLLKSFTDPIEAFKFVNTHTVDLVFLDIAMPNISGMEMVKLLQGKAKFVMVTSYSQYAIESFELDVVDYLLKPIAFERFTKTIQRFEELFLEPTPLQTNASFFIKDGEEFIKIVINDIDYIEGMKDYAKIYSNGKYHLLLKPLKAIEDFLAPHEFARVHKSYIIPLKKITNYNDGFAIVNTNKIPVSATYRHTIKTYLNSNRYS